MELTAMFWVPLGRSLAVGHLVKWCALAVHSGWMAGRRSRRTRSVICEYLSYGRAVGAISPELEIRWVIVMDPLTCDHLDAQSATESENVYDV